MSDDGVTGSNWSDREIDLIVADYFDMLRLDLAAVRFVKSHRNAALRALTGRTIKSIEYKHRNISAVLEELGEPWLRGYAPARNFQKRLTAGVERHLATLHQPLVGVAVERLQLAELADLFIGPPPAALDTGKANANSDLQRLVRRFDPAERDARNRELGRAGEELVLVRERRHLSFIGRDDLAARVRWVSAEDGDGAGYDVLSFDPSGEKRFLEVKSTAGHARTPFFISHNELEFSKEEPERYALIRLHDIARQPQGFELRPPLDSHVELLAQSWRASLR
ncbi:MAG: DUF3883 domain-containing protein [Pseudomonadota bacterium]|nr:DUF3883 domain-containing protein [Pseudomonadota bacterium]